jgi:hypothetical protein
MIGVEIWSHLGSLRGDRVGIDGILYIIRTRFVQLGGMAFWELISMCTLGILGKSKTPSSFSLFLPAFVFR